MANRYDTNLILERIADGLNDDQNSALIDALTTIANAISQGGGGDIPSGGTMGQLLGKRSNQDFDLTWYDNLGDDALSNQASIYNPQSNYVVGDYCLHTNYLYVCTSPTTGNWDPSCWNRVQFGEQLSTLNSKIADIGTVVMGTYPTTSVAKNTWVSIAKLELTKGVWVITGGYEYSTGFSARAVTQLYVGNVLLNGTYVDAKGDNGGGYNVARVYNTTSANVNIYMQAFQASTATQTVIHCDLRAVRIA